MVSVVPSVLRIYESAGEMQMVFVDRALVYRSEEGSWYLFITLQKGFDVVQGLFLLRVWTHKAGGVRRGW